MQIVDVPAGTHHLDRATHVRVDHARLDGAAPLDAGQVLVVRDRDGGLRFAAVDRLEFSATETTYLVQLGHRTDAATVGRLAGTVVPLPRRVDREPSRLEVADVVAALRTLAAEPERLLAPGHR
ncbi:hypothetical protein [Nocardioides sp.]|uniref:hypothetical protein n=1 Tax=Nocardioides sp. TaxID=35761 RepID=UPI002634D06F|nr:hypothetical protein [Nocardioides sp.]